MEEDLMLVSCDSTSTKESLPKKTKTCLNTIQKQKKNKNRRLRRKKSKLKFIQCLRELRVQRNSQDLCESVQTFDITDYLQSNSSELIKRNFRIDHEESSSQMGATQDPLLMQPLPEVIQWQHKHEVAYWKSRALSLEYENKMLHQHIKDMHSKRIAEWSEWKCEEKEYTEEEDMDVGAKGSHSQDLKSHGISLLKKSHGKNLLGKSHGKSSQKKGSKGKSSQGEDSQSESSQVKGSRDEGSQWIIVTSKDDNHTQVHRKDCTKETNLTASQEELRRPPDEDLSAKRQRDMKRLYGDKYPMVMGMETALQLNYDLTLDLHKPKYWPNMPYRP